VLAFGFGLNEFAFTFRRLLIADCDAVGPLSTAEGAEPLTALAEAGNVGRDLAPLKGGMAWMTMFGFLAVAG
jgi:hypothetical protein